jgi:hypothetical protein
MAKSKATVHVLKPQPTISKAVAAAKSHVNAANKSAQK